MLFPVAKIPELLLISPLTLICPFCGVKSDTVCETASGGKLEIVHVARIEAAAKLDRAARKAQPK
jgi:hypothetical protein